MSSSRVLSWQRDVAASVPAQTEVSINPSYKVHRHLAVPSQVSHHETPAAMPYADHQQSIEAASAPSKAIWGTLLGAAAGATVAYAMTRAETEDTFARSRNVSQQSAPAPVQRAQTYTYASPSSNYQNGVRTISGVAQGLSHAVKVIEAPPSQLASGITNFISNLRINDSPPPQPISYQSPSSQSQARSMTAPQIVTYEVEEFDGASKALSHRSRRSIADTESTLRAPRMLPLPASASTIYDDDWSKASSSKRSSKHSSSSKHSKSGRDGGSTVVLERRSTTGDASSRLRALPEGKPLVQYEFEEIDPVRPSDSVSQVSSRHSRHSKRSHRSEGERSRRSKASR